MENKSLLNKFLFLLIIIVLVIVTVFFVMNKNELGNDLNNVETVTSMNMNTYDYDLYVYKLENNMLYASEYFYNNYYLLNNNVEFDKYKITGETKYYLKNLSNTEKDIENIKITYDPISIEQVDYILKNYNLLKAYIWLDDNEGCKNIMLYTSNNVELDIEQY